MRKNFGMKLWGNRGIYRPSEESSKKLWKFPTHRIFAKVLENSTRALADNPFAYSKFSAPVADIAIATVQ